MKLLISISSAILIITLTAGHAPLNNHFEVKEPVAALVLYHKPPAPTPAGKGKKPPKKATPKKSSAKKSLKKTPTKSLTKKSTGAQKAGQKAKSAQKKVATSTRPLKKKSSRKPRSSKKKLPKKINKQSKKADLVKEKKQFFRAANSKHVRNGKTNKTVTVANQKIKRDRHANYFKFKNMDALKAVHNSDQKRNRLAAGKVKDILRKGTRTEGPPGGRYKTGYITYTLPNGQGASWHKGDGSFGGFRGPSIHNKK